jgi:hypothetical protein
MEDDAEPSAAGGEAVAAPGQPYTLAVRLHGGGIGYIALMRKPGHDGAAVWQRCVKLDRLVGALPGRTRANDGFDWYLGLNGFKRPTRRAEHLVSLRGNFVDLDSYKTAAWNAVTPEEIWGQIREVLVAADIAAPQIVVFTGRGLQAIWVYPKGIPADALPRWRAVQIELARALMAFGPDLGALDASRVVRLPGTVNSKSGRRAYFLHLDLDNHTDFERLAKSVLPVDRQELRERKAQREARRSITPSTARQSAAASFVDDVLGDLQRLIDHRWGGRVPEGVRNDVVFRYGCFLVRRTGLVALPAALAEFGRRVTDLDDWELEQIAASVSAKLTLDGKGYRFSARRLVYDLAISTAEADAACLVRLHPPDPARDEARRQARRRRDRERKAAERRAAGIPPRKRRGTPWAALGISRSAWYAKYYGK